MTAAPSPDASAPPAGSAGLRLDKWLWHARFFKSRTLAGKVCAAGKVRVNRLHVEKSHHLVRPGDVLTFPMGNDVRVVRVLALGERRGPAPEARTLYEDLAPPPPRRAATAGSAVGNSTPGGSASAASTPSASPRPSPVARREPGAGRPTKAERRETDRLRNR